MSFFVAFEPVKTDVRSTFCSTNLDIPCPVLSCPVLPNHPRLTRMRRAGLPRQPPPSSFRLTVWRSRRQFSFLVPLRQLFQPVLSPRLMIKVVFGGGGGGGSSSSIACISALVYTRPGRGECRVKRESEERGETGMERLMC